MGLGGSHGTAHAKAWVQFHFSATDLHKAPYSHKNSAVSHLRSRQLTLRMATWACIQHVFWLLALLAINELPQHRIIPPGVPAKRTRCSMHPYNCYKADAGTSTVHHACTKKPGVCIATLLQCPASLLGPPRTRAIHADVDNSHRLTASHDAQKAEVLGMPACGTPVVAFLLLLLLLLLAPCA